jgi:hypothetical protein
VLDLSFLLGEHMITRPKTARWGFDGEWHQGSCAGDPRVVMMAKRRSDETAPMEMPFRSIGSAARYCLQRPQGLFGRNLEPFHLGDLLRRIIDTDGRPKRYDAREEFIASLEAYLDPRWRRPPLLQGFAATKPRLSAMTADLLLAGRVSGKKFMHWIGARKIVDAYRATTTGTPTSANAYATGGLGAQGPRPR